MANTSFCFAKVGVPASYATLPRKQIIDQEWLKHSFFLTFLERVNSEKINLFINVQISIINGLLGQMFVPEKGRGYDGWLLVIDECLSEPLYGTVLYGMAVLGMNGPLMW